ncbi:MAG TPA: AAA family ATPase [Abditibacterium sp.]|jgi:hypothetical protein
MNSALSDRLQQARQRLFVGRAAEIESWRAAMESEAWPVPIWHLSGLGGIGKTSLLRQWKQLALAQGVAVASLDARDFPATPDAFCEALREALSEALSVSIAASATPAALCQVLSEVKQRVAVQIDTAELLLGLDHWLRNTLLPLLPPNIAVVMAGRDALPLPWRSDPGWQELVRSFQLGALSREEGLEYLERRGVEAQTQPQLLLFAHGHPLALSLAADGALRQFGAPVPTVVPPGFEANAASARFLDGPQLVGPLLRHLVRDVPSPAHRAALEACAIVNVLTEELLADMLGEDDPAPLDIHGIFEWLRSISIISTNRYGLFPHDLVREVLVADLRWRSPAWHTELHRRAREYYLRAVHRAAGVEQQRIVFNCIFLHRDSPVVAPYLHWNESDSALEVAQREQWPQLLDWIETHEGAASREIAQMWFEAQPEGLIVVRNAGGQAQGMVFQLALHRALRAQIEADPGALAAWRLLEAQAPLRPDEGATLFRFWLDKDHYQAVSPTQSLIFVQAVRHYVATPQLAFSFFPCASPQFWEDGFDYADIQRLPSADFEVEGRTYGTFGHDWRARPLLAWFELLSQREVELEAFAPPQLALASPDPSFGVLDEATFQGAVRLALRDWSNSGALKRNPLLTTSIVHRRARQLALAQSANQNAEKGGAARAVTTDERLWALRSLLREALADLAAAPRQEKAYRALELVFGRAALSQEAAADAMNVSHSSFKRYLRAALLFIGKVLWHREIEREMGENTFSLPKHIESDPKLSLF